MHVKYVHFSASYICPNCIFFIIAIDLLCFYDIITLNSIAIITYEIRINRKTAFSGRYLYDRNIKWHKGNR